MKVNTIVLALLPILGVFAAPSEHINHRSVDGWISLPVQPIAKRALTFANAVTKGKKRMADMATLVKTGIDKAGGDVQLLQLAEVPAGKRQYPEKANIDYRRALKDFLDVDGNQETFYNVELKEKSNPMGGTVYCDATYSPQTGIISADNTAKAPCIEVSDALFWEYMKIASTHNIAAINIKGIVRHRITNTDTKAIIAEIYTRAKKKPGKHDLTVKAGTDEFFALVGTPNGSAAPYMLGDHPKAIGKNTIGSIMIIHGNTHSLIFKYI